VTLHLYFARRYLTTFLSVLAVFTVMLLLLDMIDQVRRTNDDDVGFGGVLALTLLNIPSALYRILPLVTILATVALFVSLARSSELVIARAAGRSAIRALFGPVAVAVLIGVVAVAVFNPIVAATQARYEQLLSRVGGGGGSILSVSAEGLWLRQGGEDGQTVIRAARANRDGTELYDVTFLGFDPSGGPAYRIEAAEARLVTGAWQIDDAKEWRFDEANPERAAFTAERMSLASNLTRSQILDSFGTPSAVPIWELPAFIDRLERAGFAATAHRVWFAQELSTPLLLVAMVLIGAGFTMRHARFGRTGVMVLMALLMGFTLYFIRNFAAILGENGQIPVVIAAWAPPLAAVLLPLGLLLHLEDG